MNYKSQLKKWDVFLKSKKTQWNKDLRDEIFNNIKEGGDGLYNLIDEFYMFLESYNISVRSKIQHVYTIVSLFQRNRIPILKRMIDTNMTKKEKIIQSDSKDGLKKEQIIQILNKCDNSRFKLHLMALGSLGYRAAEPLKLRWKELKHVLDNSNEQPKIFLSGKLLKTGPDRYRYITKELAQMFKLWYKEKYETGKVINGKPLTYSENDLVFALRTNNTKSLYNDFWKQFDRLRKLLNINYVDANGKRCEINFKSFREYVRTQIYRVTLDSEFA